MTKKAEEPFEQEAYQIQDGYEHVGVVCYKVEVQPGLQLSALQELASSKGSIIVRWVCLLVHCLRLEDGGQRPDEGEITPVRPLGQQLMDVGFNSQSAVVQH